MKKILFASLPTIESGILLIAIINYCLIYSWARQMGGICWICPWFYPWHHSNQPTMLLIAATFLWLSNFRYLKWIGRIVAILITTRLLVLWVQYLQVYLAPRNIKYWSMVGPAKSYLFQLFLMVLIFSCAIWRSLQSWLLGHYRKTGIKVWSRTCNDWII